MTDAYFLSHNGLGDNLYSIGAVRFLSRHYRNVYMLCKDKYLSNVKLFFEESNIHCIGFDHKNEFQECKKIMDNALQTGADTFICGFHKQYLKSNITNPILKNRVCNNKQWTIDYDEITSYNYAFISNFYNDIHLDLSVFFEYWSIPISNEGIQLYDSVKHIPNIIFCQVKSSDNKILPTQFDLTDASQIILCNDYNMYSNTHEHYNLAEQFVMRQLIDYVHAIRNCNEIHIIDSCFVGIVLPLLKKNMLKTNKVYIKLR